MRAAFQVLNDDFITQIDDSQGVNLKFLAKFTYDKVGVRDTRNNRVNVTVPAGIDPRRLILAVRPEQSSNLCFRAIILASKPNPTTITIQVVSPIALDNKEMKTIFYRVSFTGYLFVSNDDYRSVASSGMEIYNYTPNKTLVFSSQSNSLRVTNFLITSSRASPSHYEGWWSWRCNTPITSITNRAYILCGGRGFTGVYGRNESDVFVGSEGLGWFGNRLIVDFFSYSTYIGYATPTYFPNTGPQGSMHPILIEVDVTNL